MSALQPQIGITIQNDSGMVIPPRSIVVCTSMEMVATGTNQETIAVHHVTQYTGQAGNIFVTGATAIPAASYNTGSGFPGSRVIGTAYSDQFIYVAIDPNVTVPNPGDIWGPVSGKWTIGPTGSGFVAQGYAEANDSFKRSIFFRISDAKIQLSHGVILNRCGPGACSLYRVQRVHRYLSSSCDGSGSGSGSGS